VTVKSAPTVDNYVGAATKGFHQNVRGLNAALDRSMEPAWIEWKNTHWKPLAQDGFKPTQDSQVVGKVDQVLGVLTQLEHLVG
jgi:hypothetical protein